MYNSELSRRFCIYLKSKGFNENKSGQILLGNKRTDTTHKVLSYSVFHWIPQTTYEAEGTEITFPMLQGRKIGVPNGSKS